MEALIRKYEEIRKKIRENAEKATIFFADLKGSTVYKLLKPPEEAQAKIYRHNETVTQGVQQCGGKVVKYLGDGVMAMFQDEKFEIKAINAAIKIQNAFKNYNDTHKLGNFDKIQSKIGINSGDVFLWNYAGHDQPDPQGTTVDIASRITDLAKPDQILCRATFKKKYSDKISVWFGGTVYRELKGLKDKIDICEVIWLDELKINETTHISPHSARIDSLLHRANLAEEQEDYFSALEKYEQILEEDPQHFLANLKLSRLILRNHRELTRYDLEDALKFANEAKESNPLSGESKNIYATLQGIINRKNLSDEMLDEIIKDCKNAKDIFKKELNPLMELVASNNLAFAYELRYKRTGDKKDLDEGIRLCEHIDKGYKTIRSFYYPSFLDTYGSLMGTRNKNGDFIEAVNMLKKAEEFAEKHHTYRDIYWHLAELYEKY